MPIPCPFTLPPGAAATRPHRTMGGVQWVIADGSGKPMASVICHRFSYGGDRGLWEIGALNQDGDLDYTTVAVGGDVLGCCDVPRVNSTLDALLQERIAKTMGVACAADHVLAQWERDHQAVTAWMDGVGA